MYNSTQVRISSPYGKINKNTHESFNAGLVRDLFQRAVRNGDVQKAFDTPKDFYKSDLYQYPEPSIKSGSAPKLPVYAKQLVGSFIAVSENDVKVKCFNRPQTTKPKAKDNVRGVITEFSKGSRDRLAEHLVNLPNGSIKSFLTLTYPHDYPTDGKLVKYHLRLVRQWFKRRSIKGVWFLEFQTRGAPHFHAFLSGYVNSSEVANYWVKVVNPSSDDQRVKMLAVHKGEAMGYNSDKNRPCIELLRCPAAAQKYATKYAYKPTQKLVPLNYQDVGRFWGSWGGLKPLWHYYLGFGDYSNNVALNMIMLWKEEILGASLSDYAVMGRNYSTTFRGGVSIIDAMINSMGWTPF